MIAVNCVMASVRRSVRNSNKLNNLVDWSALEAFFTCPSCGKLADGSPLFQCIKGNAKK